MFCDRGGSGFAHVRGLRTFGSLDHVVLHALAFRERPEAIHHDRRVVDEDVLAATVRSDEPVPLCIIEPLHRTGRHQSLSFLKRKRANTSTSTILRKIGLLGSWD